MKRRRLVRVLACAVALAATASAEQSGAGQCGSGGIAELSAALPDNAGWACPPSVAEGEAS